MPCRALKPEVCGWKPLPQTVFRGVFSGDSSFLSQGPFGRTVPRCDGHMDNLKDSPAGGFASADISLCTQSKATADNEDLDQPLLERSFKWW